MTIKKVVFLVMLAIAAPSLVAQDRSIEVQTRALFAANEALHQEANDIYMLLVEQGLEEWAEKFSEVIAWCESSHCISKRENKKRVLFLKEVAKSVQLSWPTKERIKKFLNRTECKKVDTLKLLKHLAWIAPVVAIGVMIVWLRSRSKHAGRATVTTPPGYDPFAPTAPSY